MTLRRRDTIERTAELLRASGQIITPLSSFETRYVNVNSGYDDGDGSAARPWKQLNQAYLWIAQNLDLRGFPITVQMANGIYDSFVQTEDARVATGTVQFVGTNQGSVAINGFTRAFDSAGEPFYPISIDVDGPKTFTTFSNVRLIAVADYDCIYASGANDIVANGGIVVEGTPYGLISSFNGGSINFGGELVLDTNSIQYFAYVENAKAEVSGLSLRNVSSLTLATAGFQLSLASYCRAILGTNIQGPVAGTKYDVSGNSILNSFGLDVPGDAPGSTSTGGIFI